jgi:hypothetical protein
LEISSLVKNRLLNVLYIGDVLLDVGSSDVPRARQAIGRYRRIHITQNFADEAIAQQSCYDEGRHYQSQ